MDLTKLTDPTEEYCKQYASALSKIVKLRIKFWYKMYRCFGCTAVESIALSRTTTQDEFNECDFSVNFDGPMAM